MRKAKIVALLLTVVCMVFLFASCGGLNESNDSEIPIESNAGNVPATTQQGFEADESIEEPFDSEEETQGTRTGGGVSAAQRSNPSFRCAAAVCASGHWGGGIIQAIAGGYPGAGCGGEEAGSIVRRFLRCV